MPAVIYARFSPRPDAETSESNDTQLDLCRPFCARKGWPIKAERQDEALSGADAERPGLWQAIDDLEKGDVLVVYRLDRLARDPYLSYIIEEAVAKKKARIISVCGEGTEDDSPDSLLIRGILKELNAHTRRVTAARTKAAMQRHQAGGRRMGRADRCPWGQKPDPANEERMVHSPEDELAAQRIKELRAQGLGYRAIGWQLAREGILCRGRQWYASTVRKILARATLP